MSAGPTCTSADRRRLLVRRGEGVPTGIDEVEVDADPRRLRVSFLGSVPEGLTAANVRILGGRRVTGIVAREVEVQAADEDRDSRLVVLLDRAGDGTAYTLRLVERGGEAPHPALDPRYAEAVFRFGLDCSGLPDCAEAPCPPEDSGPSPDIAYTARDYEGFRAQMLDRLALTIPEWGPLPVPDLGLTLVEVLAFHADRLAYLQEAVAAEAYLGTARRRASVRRHLRLVGYRLHEGVDARALLALTVEAPLVEAEASDVAFVFGAEDGAAGAWFEPLGAGRVAAASDRNAIRFWTWMESACCLPTGATSATLRIAAARLAAGEILVLGENPEAGGDPARRHPVRIARVEAVRDPLAPEEALAEVWWDAEEALPFALCLSARRETPPCGVAGDLAVAWGNVVLVDHGRSRERDLGEPPEVEEEACVCGVAVTIRRPTPRWRPALPGGPVVHAVPFGWRPGTVADALRQDPAQAVPALMVAPADGGAAWTAVPDLLRSGPGARHLVLEPGDPPVLRFGDGRQGEPPGPGVALRLHWREGGGSAGDLPADATGRMVRRDGGAAPPVRVVNLLPAAGQDPEALEQARREGPLSRRGALGRAVLAEDYAQIAREDAALQGAAARLTWTGSWYAAEVALDPLGAEAPSAALLQRVRRRLRRARRIGHDLEVEAARAVALDIGLTVCARPGMVAGHVRAAVREALGVVPRRDGRPGFFHPDLVGIGAPVRGSAIVAKVMALPGVLACRLDRLARRGTAGEAVGGVLRLGPKEVARLEDGGLVLRVEGGR